MKHNYFKHILLCLCLFSGISAFAYDAEINGIYYYFLGDEAWVTQGTGSNSYSGDIVIPESVTYNGFTFPVTGISGQAFSGCSNLTSITISNSVTSIGYAAFSGCSSLTFLTIPNSVSSIGIRAFEGTAWFDAQPNGLVYAGKVAYKYKGTMPNGTNIVIKEGTLGIAGDAFTDCNGLASVTIPEGLTSIGDGAFCRCNQLTSVDIPISVKTIVHGAFIDCI